MNNKNFIQDTPSGTFSLFISKEFWSRMHNDDADAMNRMGKLIGIWTASITGTDGNWTHRGWEFDPKDISKEMVKKIFWSFMVYI